MSKYKIHKYTTTYDARYPLDNSGGLPASSIAKVKRKGDLLGVYRMNGAEQHGYYIFFRGNDYMVGMINFPDDLGGIPVVLMYEASDTADPRIAIMNNTPDGLPLNNELSYYIFDEAYMNSGEESDVELREEDKIPMSEIPDDFEILYYPAKKDTAATYGVNNLREELIKSMNHSFK